MPNDISHIKKTLALVKNYLTGEATWPCFVAFDNLVGLHTLKDELSSCTKIRLSNYCLGNDVKPDLDRILRFLRSQRGNVMFLGAGEYVALTGDIQFLEDISTLVLGNNAKLVVPLWNGYDFISRKVSEDPRWEERGVAISFQKSGNLWQVKKVGNRLPVQVKCDGFKFLLRTLEMGCEEEVTVKTSVWLSDRWVTHMESAYAAYKSIFPESKAQESLFPEEIWETFLDKTRSKNKSLESADMLLALIENPPSNKYLQFVVDTTEQFADYEDKLISALLNIPIEAPEFVSLYNAKKEALAGWLDETRAALYVKDASKLAPSERVAYLSNETLCEKKAILKCIAATKAIPESLVRVWPELADYMKSFKFTMPDEELADLLNSYFDEYKKCKLFNAIPPSFMSKVNDIALERPYYRLPTRGSIVESSKVNGTYLYWLDALGCEYLGYIENLAVKHGLQIKVQFSRADLPTITSVNNSFWDEWSGKKEQSKDLDKIKHGDFPDDKTDSKTIPINLIYELQVLDKIIGRIAAILKVGDAKKVALASDHGTTRLAVVSGAETIWEMPEKGKHGGRCCKKCEFQGQLPPFATESDNAEWYALANYDRFKGGRAADVEVHGGASIEEIVVPVIEFSLMDNSIKVELLNPIIKTTRHDLTIMLSFFSRRSIENFFVEYQGKLYDGVVAEEGKIEVKLPKPQAGEYEIKVFTGDISLGMHKFTVSNSGVTIKRDSDFFN